MMWHKSRSRLRRKKQKNIRYIFVGDYRILPESNWAKGSEKNGGPRFMQEGFVAIDWLCQGCGDPESFRRSINDRVREGFRGGVYARKSYRKMKGE
jgi:hypothetical protein